MSDIIEYDTDADGTVDSVEVNFDGEAGTDAMGQDLDNDGVFETIDIFERLCEGEGDDLPESAFMYVGTLEEAKKKAEKIRAG